MLTAPITYGLPASPNKWQIRILKAEAVDLLFGCITYNKISDTNVQLKHKALIAIPDIAQNITGCAVLVIKIKTKSAGTAIKEPTAHTRASAYGLSDRSL